MIHSDHEKKILGLIDEQELVKLAVDLGNIYSPAGHEQKMADFVFDWLKFHSIEASMQEIVTGRCNVIGLMYGTGDGLSLLFNSHMDSGIGGHGEQWALADFQSEQYEKAWVEEDRIFGNAVLNDRGPMAAFMIAAKAIKESGCQLNGDLILTMVVGEIGMAPIDEFQGARYLGKGLGSRHLVNHGIVPNYALVAETTDFGITWVEAGVAYIKLTITGEAIYTPRSRRSEKIEDHPNAIVKMAYLINRLEEWAEQYEKDNTCWFSGIKMVPKVAIGAIRGGVPYKPYRTSGVCSIYIDVRIPPGKTVPWVKDQLRQLVRSLNMEAKIQFYLYRAGYEGKNVSRLIESVESSYQKTCGQKIGAVPTPVTSMWRDINVFNEVGIPAITFGPPRCSPDEAEKAKGKFLNKRDLLNTSKIYALVAMDICGLNKR